MGAHRLTSRNILKSAGGLSAVMVLGRRCLHQARVSADNPIERLRNYRGKRILMAAGTSPELTFWDTFNEVGVLETQREFRGLLDGAGVQHDSHKRAGGHTVDPRFCDQDLKDIIGRLHKARPGGGMMPGTPLPQFCSSSAYPSGS